MRSSSATAPRSDTNAAYCWVAATYFDPLGCRFRGCQISRAYNPDVTAKAKQDLLTFLELE